MKIKIQDVAIRRRLCHNRSCNRYRITIGCATIGHVENKRRIAIWMGNDPFLYQFFSYTQRLAHVCPSICLRLYPNRKIYYGLFSTLKKAFTPLYPQRIVSEGTDRDEVFTGQCSAKKSPNSMAIANYCHIKVITYHR